MLACATSCLTARLLHPARGPDRHGELATPLQRGQAHASLGYKPPASEAFAACGYATSTGFAGHAGAQANPKLTFHLDYSVGADRSELIGSSFSLKTVLEVRKLAHHDTLLSGGSIPSIARKKPKSA